MKNNKKKGGGREGKNPELSFTDKAVCINEELYTLPEIISITDGMVDKSIVSENSA